MSEEWRTLADRVRNWGRWGEHDQLGCLNHITADALAGAATLATQGKSFSLAIPLDGDSPMGPHGLRRAPVHLMSLDGGDESLGNRLQGFGGYAAREAEALEQTGPFRANDDWILMPLQSSTQWDALCHGYYEGQMYNGVPASASTSLGVTRNAIDTVAAAGGVAGRGVLLDVARHRGVAHLEPQSVVTAQELDAVATAQGVTIHTGDIVLVRTGWWPRYAELGVGNGVEWQMGSPGLDWRAAEWLHDHDIAAVACDNVAVEPTMPADNGLILTLHMLTLRDMGLMLGELWDLEALATDCAADGIYEFFLTAPPLRVTGGTGSPINPIAFK
ncbi:cyclase family protein [Rhodococcus koreensis]|uniref:cyclase family protein n=1 Tax=Rhodococcus koreensis TaxID=99653 RepID=UPI00366DAFC1